MHGVSGRIALQECVLPNFNSFGPSVLNLSSHLSFGACLGRVFVPLHGRGGGRGNGTTALC